KDRRKKSFLRPPCESMFPGDPDPVSAQLDFFHKLGYSTAQVRAVQRKFGPSTDTDKVLGQLVQVGAGREEDQQKQQGPVTTVSVLVSRGDGPAGGAALLLPVSEGGGEDEDALRPVVIDGSNVAMSHGNKEVFSCLGIQLAVNFFLDRGHDDITVFVPSWRKEQPRPDVPITDQHILLDLEKKKILVFTPSRRFAGKRVVCNDDCFIVKHAFESDGIIVSNDMYRDLQGTKPEWKRFIEERLLMYSFVNNKFMPPDDPLGRYGPTLENFLRKFPKTQKKQQCPYGKKCTYGIKCKFHHPERAKQSNRSVADELRENAKNPCAAQKAGPARCSPDPGQSLLLVEDMAKKLTLGHESASLKKDHKNKHPVKSGHRSSKRASTRKAIQPSDSARHGGSQEQLDSGLGSIDSQPLEAHCCSRGTTPAFQHHSVGPVSCHSADMLPFGPPPYPCYGAYPLSVPAYNQQPDFQHSRVHPQQPFWSDPFGAHPRHWDPPPHPPPPSGKQPSSEEREVVRKKLLAIFSAQLVDAAMDMFPQLMDPQKLVAEILMLQSQNRSLR
uniref:Ribonuclease ZC3H12A-like n=1 Tax=Stegastes partitus TaxID=144197 RepID=A0A3B5BCF3_9TELE